MEVFMPDFLKTTNKDQKGSCPLSLLSLDPPPPPDRAAAHLPEHRS